MEELRHVSLLSLAKCAGHLHLSTVYHSTVLESMPCPGFLLRSSGLKGVKPGTWKPSSMSMPFALLIGSTSCQSVIRSQGILHIRTS